MGPNDAVKWIFQQYLGRWPNEGEMAGFSQAIQSGILDPTGLSLFIQGSSEYQQKMAPQVAQRYMQTLGTADEAALQRGMGLGMETATAQMRRLGRPYSSGLEAAYAQVAGQGAERLAAQRQSYLAPILGQYYQNPAAGAPAQYGQAYQSQKQRDWQAEQARLERETQADYYGQAMRQARENQWWQLGGSLLGAGGKALGGSLSRPRGG